MNKSIGVHLEIVKLSMHIYLYGGVLKIIWIALYFVVHELYTFYGSIDLFIFMLKLLRTILLALNFMVHVEYIFLRFYLLYTY